MKLTIAIPDVLSKQAKIPTGAVLHLACAVEHSFNGVHSHESHVLAATPWFGLRGLSVIAK